MTVRSIQVVPPSRLICAFSLLPSCAVREPFTTTWLSLVMKSFALRPVSFCRESMLIPIDGAVRSTVTVWLSLALLPMALLTCALITYEPPSASAVTSALPTV